MLLCGSTLHDALSPLALTTAPLAVGSWMSSSNLLRDVQRILGIPPLSATDCKSLQQSGEGIPCIPVHAPVPAASAKPSPPANAPNPAVAARGILGIPEPPSCKEDSERAKVARFYEDALPAAVSKPKRTRLRFQVRDNDSMSPEIWREILQEELLEAVKGAQPASTRKAYDTYQMQYRDFCVRMRYSEPLGPNADVQMAAFLVDCATRPKPLAQATILGPVAACLADLSRLSATKPMRSPAVEAAKLVAYRKAPLPKRAKQPLSPEIMSAIAKAMDREKTAKVSIRDRALLTVMLFACLRRSEAVALTNADVSVAGSAAGQNLSFTICVRKAKNDRREHTRKLFALGIGKFGVCPVAALTAYWPLRAGNAASPFFFDFTEELKRPLALQQTRKPLASATPNVRLKYWMAKAGFAEDVIACYGSHSLRKAAVTAGYAAGVPEDVIKAAGNWEIGCRSEVQLRW